MLPASANVSPAEVLRTTLLAVFDCWKSSILSHHQHDQVMVHLECLRLEGFPSRNHWTQPASGSCLFPGAEPSRSPALWISVSWEVCLHSTVQGLNCSMLCPRCQDGYGIKSILCLTCGSWLPCHPQYLANRRPYVWDIFSAKYHFYILSDMLLLERLTLLTCYYAHFSDILNYNSKGCIYTFS